MLHIRGSERALDAIKKIVLYTGWKALDTSAGDFIDFNNNPDKGFSQWREYRNKVAAEVVKDEEMVVNLEVSSIS